MFLIQSYKMTQVAEMNKGQEETMDRITELPAPIVHHIMSFLPTLDLSKISILSKSFFILWSTFSDVVFHEPTFKRGNLDSTINDFLDHIHNSIRLRLRTNVDTAVHEFRIKADLQEISDDPRLDSAISYALDHGVKSMVLDLGFGNYQFPVSFASKSINALRLQGLNLDLRNLILSCPSLKTVSLTSCVILRDMEFWSDTVTEIELHSCDVKVIKITAPKLHSFFFDPGIKDPQPCSIDVLQCQNIAYLSLHNLVDAHDWVEEHASKLGKLETFILNGCQDINSIVIRNERVERIEISNCPLLDSIKVRAPSLQSFQYKGTYHRHIRVSNINFIASTSIKDLYIANAGITDEWLTTQLTKLCCLKSLTLKACNSLKKIGVIHEKLQILELLDCKKLEEADIDTPLLVSFVHTGNIIEFQKMVTRSIMCTANLGIKPWKIYNNETFYGWRKLLSFFGHFKVLNLFCNCEKELIIPEHLRDRLVPPLYDLRSLEVYVKSLERIETDLVDSLLWLSPLPDTIRIYSGSRSQLQMIIKFVYNKTMKEEDEKEDDYKNPIFCCRNKPIKCWRHKLRRLDIQTRDKNRSVKLQKYFLTNAMMLEILSFNELQDDLICSIPSG